jgi:hypothetical protein
MNTSDSESPAHLHSQKFIAVVRRIHVVPKKHRYSIGSSESFVAHGFELRAVSSSTERNSGRCRYAGTSLWFRQRANGASRARTGDLLGAIRGRLGDARDWRDG